MNWLRRSLACANKPLAENNKTLPKSCTYISVNRRGPLKPSGAWAKLLPASSAPEELSHIPLGPLWFRGAAVATARRYPRFEADGLGELN